MTTPQDDAQMIADLQDAKFIGTGTTAGQTNTDAFHGGFLESVVPQLRTAGISEEMLEKLQAEDLEEEYEELCQVLRQSGITNPDGLILSVLRKGWTFSKVQD